MPSFLVFIQKRWGRTPPSTGTLAILMEVCKSYAFGSEVTMSHPDQFGWRTSWIAVRMTNPQFLAPEMGFANLRPCGWEEGLREASERGIFICPPVSGWTLIVGVTLQDASNDDTLPLIVRLSEAHAEAQYFGNHRIVDYYAWAKAEGGRLVRAYAFLGEKGATLWDRGEITVEERELGLVFDDSPASPNIHGFSDSSSLELPQTIKRAPAYYPTEEAVFAIARRWSVDPTQIEEYEVSESPGVLGYLP